MHLGRKVTHGAPKAVWGGVEAILGQAASSASANPQLIFRVGKRISVAGLTPLLPWLICSGRSFALISTAEGEAALEQRPHFLSACVFSGVGGSPVLLGSPHAGCLAGKVTCSVL